VAKDAIDERAGESAANSPTATIQESEMDNEKHSPTRRAVIGHAALGLAAGAALDGMSPALAQTDRKTFVLVHGSSAGGWCYRRVADILEK
jgi:hypothetical protein